MKFTLEIELDEARYDHVEEACRRELARLIRQAAGKLDYYCDKEVGLLDHEGETVGEYTYRYSYMGQG